jgi:Holliday junction resolvase-like predicted endonuclease
LEIKPETSNFKNRMGVIDLIAHDPKTDEAVLVMNQPDAWDGSDEQLFHLQERFNTYASFLLDGEFAESHPELAGKRARIEVRCEQMPDARVIDLLGSIHDQLAFQEIKMEVVVPGDRACGPSCGCH